MRSRWPRTRQPPTRRASVLTQRQAPRSHDLLALRDDLARWLLSTDITQWEQGELPADRRARWVHGGAVRVLREDDHPVAAVAIVDDDPIWAPDPVAAGYVHLLMVASHAHRGLGAAVLAAAERTVQETGASCVRLDAVATNRRLIRCYLDKGYAPMGTVPFDDPGMQATLLLHKPVTFG